MNKQILFGGIILFLVLFSASVLAEAAELKDTKIDYIPYRELVVNDPGVVYQIKIANTGTKEKTYEIIPSTDVIKEIGSYRIDPSYIITVKPGKEETAYFYLAIEKAVSGRKTIPVEVRSGSSSTTINLVARPIGGFQQAPTTNMFADVFKTIFSIIIIAILLMATALLFRRIKKKKEQKIEKDSEDEVQTYY
jgi:hypothetical protein